MKSHKAVSLAIVAILYAAAFMVGLFVFYCIPSSPLLAFFLADIAATLIVWIFGIAHRNPSVYDPYWSVAPVVLMIGFLLVSRQLSIPSVIYLAVFFLWGLRLTLNWAIGWQGMHHQDWRYAMLKKDKPKLWPLTNLFGINLMPTLIVFATMLPAYFVSLHMLPVNVLTVIGALICLLAALLQMISDEQMRHFRRDQNNRGKNMKSGLWTYSRHPNYLGEVMLWWGVWVIQISVLPELWWTVCAPMLMTMLFVFISIPMMEKKLLASKYGYAAYQKSTSMLLLLPKKAPMKEEAY